MEMESLNQGTGSAVKMWKFEIALNSGKIFSIIMEDGKESTDLFVNVQEWIRNPENSLYPSSITIKCYYKTYYVFKIKDIAYATIAPYDLTDSDGN